MFMIDEISKLKKQIPNISGKELMKLVGKNWSTIKNEESSQIYYEQAENETKKKIKNNIETLSATKTRKAKRPGPLPISKF